jgi:alpha-ribazole phosphatase
MEIYLIRHTTPDIPRGVCYGQADIDVKETFHAEASMIKKHLPDYIQHVYSSPLKRCRKLAEWLFPRMPVLFHDDLKEINFGDWELKKWDDISKDETQPWMENFVNVCAPGGENYVRLFNRSIDLFNQIEQTAAVAIVTHGGVIRSILSHITNTSLKDSFHTFSLHYGCVVKIFKENNQYTYEFIHNMKPAEV